MRIELQEALISEWWLFAGAEEKFEQHSLPHIPNTWANRYH